MVSLNGFEMSEWFSKHPKSTHLFVRHLTIYGSTGSGSISSTKVKDYPWSSRATSIMHNKNNIWPSTDSCLTGLLKLDWLSKHMGITTKNMYAGELEPKKESGLRIVPVEVREKILSKINPRKIISISFVDTPILNSMVRLVLYAKLP